MNVKDIIEVEIESNGMDGEGVTHLGGKAVFIPYTLKGEKVRAVVKSVKSRYATASVIKVLRASLMRETPLCSHYFKCGGCDTQHISAEYRREIILNEIAHNLKSIACVEFTPTEFVSSVASTRNKISMPFGLCGGKVIAGMYRRGTHDVEPACDCIMAGELTRVIVNTVVSFANEKKLSVYDEKSGDGLLRHIVVREIDGRASVTLVVNGELGDKTENALAERLPDSADFFISTNTKRNNVIMGDNARLVKGNARLSVSVLGVRAELSPLSFFQVNDAIRDELYKRAIGYVSSPMLYDLYSGIGITSNLAAKKCRAVHAVEIVPQAVADADCTALENGNDGIITNHCGTVESILPRICGGEAQADVLVDPPRKGCGEAVMSVIAGASPNKLIYISCNHATMARDIKLFIDASKVVGNNYELKEVTAFDMFVGTHHVETLAELTRKD